jgi:hypothetical protein
VAVKAYLIRLDDDGKQTLGNLFLFRGADLIFSCCTLELPWKDNRRSASCIPTGDYKCAKRWSEKYKNHFHVQHVPGRQYILIHQGNYYTQTEGCILVGTAHTDINLDGHRDVISSRTTMMRLVQTAPDGFDLRVVS